MLSSFNVSKVISLVILFETPKNLCAYFHSVIACPLHLYGYFFQMGHWYFYIKKSNDNYINVVVIIIIANGLLATVPLEGCGL